MALSEKSDSWEKWLAEVEIIMTRAEKSVFKSLKTEEDRKRFPGIILEGKESRSQILSE